MNFKGIELWFMCANLLLMKQFIYFLNKDKMNKSNDLFSIFIVTK